MDTIKEIEEKFTAKLKDLMAEFKIEAFIPIKCSDCSKKDECTPILREIESANSFLHFVLLIYAEYLRHLLPAETIIYNVKGVVDEWVYEQKKKLREKWYGAND